MHQLPDDGKRFLVVQHRASQPASPAPLRPVSTGPSPSSDSSLLGNVKRFSLASVGWGGYAPSSVDSEPSPTPARPLTTAGAPASSPSSRIASAPQRDVAGAAPHLQSQETGTSSSWTSWWSSPSHATGTGQSTSEAKDSPQFYRDQLRSTCVRFPPARISFHDLC